MQPTTVFVADDHPIYRAAIARIIRDAGYAFVGEADDGREALRQIRDLGPDITVLDLDMPVMSGQTVVEATQALGLGTRILVLSGSAEAEQVYSAIRTGACGYVTKAAHPTEIAKALALTARGGCYLPENLMSGLAAQIRATAPEEIRLTKRELEVLGLTAQGMSMTEIATSLQVGQETVKTHLRRIRERLGAKSTAAAIYEATRRGLL